HQRDIVSAGAQTDIGVEEILDTFERLKTPKVQKNGPRRVGNAVPRTKFGALAGREARGEGRNSLHVHSHLAVANVEVADVVTSQVGSLFGPRRQEHARQRKESGVEHALAPSSPKRF